MWRLLVVVVVWGGCGASAPAVEVGCGDGVVDPDEACDDGNRAPGDGCSPDCRSLEVCGNGIVDFGEQCDDGATQDGDGCSSGCVTELPVWRQAPVLQDPPSIRLIPSLTFDAARGKVILFGGEPPGSFEDDTWEWDGAMWTERAPATVPPGRRGNALAYDAARTKVVMFGGVGQTAIVADTWEWDGTDWLDRTPSTSPPARFYHAMAYDSARGRVVLFGGIGELGFGLLGDTWEWDGASWIDVTPATSPTARSGAALVYDEARGRIVLFGGDASDTNFSDETWEWDGTSWTLQSPTLRPPGRANHAAAYLAEARSVVVFGGAGAGPGGAAIPIGDTWAWDGTNWARLVPASPPQGRGVFGMTYDAARHEVVLFGGSDNQSFLNDTWSLRFEEP